MAIKISGTEVISDTRNLANISGIDASSITNMSTTAVPSQAEAEAGVINNKWMTPLRTAQAIAELAAGGIEYTRITSATTAVEGQGYICDTGGGTFTLTLPATPLAGNVVVVADGGNFGTTNLTVARNGSTIDGDAENLILDIAGVAVTFVYDGTTWQIYAQIGANSGEVVTLTDTQTVTNKTLTAPVINNGTITSANVASANITSSSIFSSTITNPTFQDGMIIDTETYSWTGAQTLDPANGLLQEITMTGNITFSDSLADGESIILHIDDGVTRTITWPTITWISGDGTAPTLQTTGDTVITVWKVGTILYGFASNGA